MLTGHYPFADDHPALLSEATDPREFNPLMSESVVEVLLKSLAKEPDDRFQTAKAMLDAVQAADWKPGWQPYHVPSSNCPDSLSQPKNMKSEL